MIYNDTVILLHYTVFTVLNITECACDEKRRESRILLPSEAFLETPYHSKPFCQPALVSGHVCCILVLLTSSLASFLYA